MTSDSDQPQSTQDKYANSARRFRQHIARDLNNPQLRSNFRAAMDYLIDKRRNALPDPQELQQLRQQCQAIKQHCLLKLPELLEQLERKLQENGIQVHWAQSTTEANAIIAELIAAQGGQQVIKGKSMVSEETSLNDYLQARGIDCLESDMGEYIVQLAKQHPSHIIMPAIHQNKAQVADLFAEHIDGFRYTTDVDALIQQGRRVLRDKFRQADVGISGVNFAIADTGTLCLVENEGNGRMCTTVPELHIAITGIEKVIASIHQLPPLLSLLTRSATGQAITTYVNLISRPRQPGEKDGPRAVHLVLLDNGRSQAFADTELRQTLQCIRCGACMNHCPVYTRIGGHAYGTVYPGPIGQIISPHMLGLDATRDLPSASSLCGACAEVCPVKIPIPRLLLRLREESVKAPTQTPVSVRGQGSARKPGEAWIWRLWAIVHADPRLYRLMSATLSACRALLPRRLRAWSLQRELPRVAPRSLHALLRQRQQQEQQDR